ncbi:MAG TPA: glycosyltransferase family 2 protein [Patescibacteria group bacterium]|nr:glycosyltransferase family 2 protein [Patescibacteria group bacterium]
MATSGEKKNLITAIILTKNAEELIGDCIESVTFCDEIIVIDDDSTDRTTEIAKILQVKVYPLIARSFAERRNFGVKKATGKWLLYIDADERVSPELKESILEAVSREKTRFAAFRLKRKNFYLGKHEWPHIEHLERLFKKSALEEWYGDLHESAKVAGSIGGLEGFLLHYTHQDLSSMLSKTIEWSEIEAKLRFTHHHPKMTWWRFPRVMITAFWDSYVKQQGYKAGTVGIVESMYQAFSMFITYARLWEMQQENQRVKIKNQK